MSRSLLGAYLMASLAADAKRSRPELMEKPHGLKPCPVCKQPSESGFCSAECYKVSQARKQSPLMGRRGKKTRKERRK